MTNLIGKAKPSEILIEEADIEAEVVDTEAEATGEAAAGDTTIGQERAITLPNALGAAQRDTCREIAEHLHI
ncbi:unnamed protein product [Calypogeia fissa]